MNLEPIFRHLVMGDSKLLLVGFSVVAENMPLNISYFTH